MKSGSRLQRHDLPDGIDVLATLVRVRVDFARREKRTQLDLLAQDIDRCVSIRIIFICNAEVETPPLRQENKRMKLATEGALEPQIRSATLNIAPTQSDLEGKRKAISGSSVTLRPDERCCDQARRKSWISHSSRLFWASPSSRQPSDWPSSLP